MANGPARITVTDWRRELPVLHARTVSLREPTREDLPAVVSLLSLPDATRFGIDDRINEPSVLDFIAKVERDRASGLAFTYAVTANSTGSVVGLVQVRQLDPAWEGAEWESTLSPSVRGTGAFLEMARLAGSFAFDEIGAHRIEARVILQNGRANGALLKLGAVQEGVLRRSLRRGSEYLDQVLWSVLKEDWDPNRVLATGRVH
jgi:ribosomal-protein-alanine N-acetyltransferase